MHTVHEGLLQTLLSGPVTMGSPLHTLSHLRGARDGTHRGSCGGGGGPRDSPLRCPRLNSCRRPNRSCLGSTTQNKLRLQDSKTQGKQRLQAAALGLRRELPVEVGPRWPGVLGDTHPEDLQTQRQAKPEHGCPQHLRSRIMHLQQKLIETKPIAGRTWCSGVDSGSHMVTSTNGLLISKLGLILRKFKN